MTTSTLTLWRRIFDGGEGLVCVAALDRTTDTMHQQFYPWPHAAGNAEAWLQGEERRGRDVYFCAHLLTDPGKPKDRARRKDRAAKLYACYVDGDGATPPAHLQPTIAVQSSPGRDHFWYVLSRAVEPAVGEEINRRLAHAMGADRSGFDLTQLLRPPGFPNLKYPDAPAVTVTDDGGPIYDPDELLAALPPAPASFASSSTEPIDLDEPPVPLEGYALEVHQGKHAPLTEKGTVDRSRAAWQLACTYEEGGLNASALRILVPLRVEALGWGKGEDYDKLIAKVMARPPGEARVASITTPRAAPDPASPCAALQARIDQLEAHNAALEAALSTAQERFRKVLAIDRNPEIKAQRSTAKAVAWELTSATETGRTDEQGWVKFWMPDIATNAGCSDDTASTHISTMARDGLIEKDLRYEKVETQLVDRETGEVMTEVTTRPRVYLRLVTTPDALLDNITIWKPSPSPKKPARGSWGGQREARTDVRCPEHPDAGLLCAVCGEVVAAGAGGEPQDAGHEDEPTTPPDCGEYQQPQDAGHQFSGRRLKDIPDGMNECTRCKGPTAPTRTVCWNCQAEDPIAGFGHGLPSEEPELRWSEAAS